MRDVVGGCTSSQIVVRLREGAFRNPQLQNQVAAAGRDADPLAVLDRRIRDEARNWRAGRMRPAYAGDFAHPELAARYGLDRTYIVEVPAGTDTETMAAAFARLPDVEIATVDTIGGVAADPLPPNDTRFGEQYALHNTGQFVQGQAGVSDADIDAIEAWKIHTGDLGTVTIAIIDSGVNSHTEYGTNSGQTTTGRIIPGYNTNNPLTPFLTTDGCPHGTHVTGIAAASGNNNLGVAGVTWGAYILPIRVLNGCSGVVSQLADGIRKAADLGADVGNVSLHYYNITVAESNLLRDAIAYARSAGMLLIAAAGNNNPGIVAYPGRMADVLSVSATNNDDVFCNAVTCGWNSNNGNELDLCAPGDDILSTWTNGSYTYLFGTSMATPHVTGLAALVKSYRIEFTPIDLELILIGSVDDLGPPGWDNQYGFGRINAHQALLLAEAWRGVVTQSEPPNESIDARKPKERDDSMTFDNWQVIDLTMSVYGSLQTPQDFMIEAMGGVAGPPTVANVSDLGQERIQLYLSRPVEEKTWTTIEHLGSGVRVRVGVLPGDVNASGAMDGADVTALVAALVAPSPTRPIWSLDIDRSGLPTAADILEVVDLYNGAEAYEEYFGAELP